MFSHAVNVDDKAKTSSNADGLGANLPKTTQTKPTFNHKHRISRTIKKCASIAWDLYVLHSGGVWPKLGTTIIGLLFDNHYQGYLMSLCPWPPAMAEVARRGPGHGHAHGHGHGRPPVPVPMVVAVVMATSRLERSSRARSSWTRRQPSSRPPLAAPDRICSEFDRSPDSLNVKFPKLECPRQVFV